MVCKEARSNEFIKCTKLKSLPRGGTDFKGMVVYMKWTVPDSERRLCERLRWGEGEKGVSGDCILTVV